MKKKEEKLEKTVSYHLGGSKRVFLLGKDSEGIRYWLEEASWDCGWYWGFGYVETYKFNRYPSKASDIDSHQHIDSSFLGKQEYYDSAKGCFRLDNNYVHNLFDARLLTEKTFTYEEGWKLSELFKQFYLLKDMAAFAGRENPNCHVTSNFGFQHPNLKDWAEEINKRLMPNIFNAIYDILTPEEDKEKKGK